MGINPKHLKELTTSVLKSMGYYSEEAVDLLMLTAAVESDLGYHLYQIGGGPARGILQMEPATRVDIYKNFLNFGRETLKSSVDMFASWAGAGYDMVGNIPYQIAIGRVHFLRVKERIPKRRWYDSGMDIMVERSRHIYVTLLAIYWKKHWNTPLGKGSVRGAISSYYELVLEGRIEDGY